VQSRTELSKPWNQHTKEEKVLKCDEAGIPRSITLRAYHISPNSITKLKKKEEGASGDEDPIVEITRMLCDGVDPSDILKEGYHPGKISKAVDDLNELEGKYTKSDYMQARKLLLERGYDVDSSMPLKSGVLKVLAEKQERGAKISSLNNDIEHAGVLNNNLNNQVTGLAEENNRLRIKAQQLARQKESLEAVIKKEIENMSSQEVADLSSTLADLAKTKAKVERLVMERRYRELIKAH